MVEFIAGLAIGGIIGVAAMCVLIMAKDMNEEV